MHPQQIRRPLRTPAIAVAITIASCIAVLPAALAFTFQIVFDEESLTCPGREAINMSSFLDLSGVTFSRDSDNGMVLNGKAVWQVDTKPNDRLSFKVDCMHNDRGVFKSSPFVYVMHSFCPEEFNPKRAWYNMTRSFTTAEQRKCPPPKGTVLDLTDAHIVPRYTIPMRMKEGEYVCNIEALVNERLVSCFAYKGDVQVLSLN